MPHPAWTALLLNRTFEINEWKTVGTSLLGFFVFFVQIYIFVRATGVKIDLLHIVWEGSNGEVKEKIDRMKKVRVE